MKTIGLIGGMSWESTATYYQLINEGVKQVLGGLHSAKLLLYSVDFAEIEVLQASGDWAKSAQMLAEAARILEQAGAQGLVICTNTMHKVAPQIAEQVTIPLLHIAQATAEALCRDGIRTVGLLGTKYTMTQDFYKDQLLQAGLEVVIPDATSIEQVNRIIYDELCLGQINDSSKQTYLTIMEQLRQAGAQAIILGCTEIGLLVTPADTDLPLYDTTAIHAQAAVEFMVGEENRI